MKGSLQYEDDMLARDVALQTIRTIASRILTDVDSLLHGQQGR